MRTSCSVLIRVAVMGLCLAAFSAGADDTADVSTPEEALRAVETAFAQTMADRDHPAFTSFLDEETVFFAGATVARGRSAVAAAWKPFFDGAAAPFSWSPDAVAVLDSGELGLSSGPVYDPEGKRVGTFNSVWRKDRTGAWKVVFDRGCPPCSVP